MKKRIVELIIAIDLEIIDRLKIILTEKGNTDDRKGNLTTQHKG